MNYKTIKSTRKNKDSVVNDKVKNTNHFSEDKYNLLYSRSFTEVATPKYTNSSVNKGDIKPLISDDWDEVAISEVESEYKSSLNSIGEARETIRLNKTEVEKVKKPILEIIFKTSYSEDYNFYLEDIQNGIKLLSNIEHFYDRYGINETKRFINYIKDEFNNSSKDYGYATLVQIILSDKRQDLCKYMYSQASVATDFEQDANKKRVALFILKFN